MNPDDVVVASPELRYGIPWDVLVGARTHETVPMLSRRAVSALLAEPFMRICEAGANLVLCQAGVVATDLGLAPPLREQRYDKFNRQTRTADDRLSRQDSRV